MHEEQLSKNSLQILALSGLLYLDNSFNGVHAFNFQIYKTIESGSCSDIAILYIKLKYS